MNFSTLRSLTLIGTSVDVQLEQAITTSNGSDFFLFYVKYRFDFRIGNGTSRTARDPVSDPSLKRNVRDRLKTPMHRAIAMKHNSPGGWAGNLNKRTTKENAYAKISYFYSTFSTFYFGLDFGHFLLRCLKNF